MMPIKSALRRICCSLGAIVLASATVHAQTGPELLLNVWPKGEHVQGKGEVTLVNEGSTKNSDEFGLAFYDTSGRVRLRSGERADPRAGWNYTHINTSGDPALPSNLIDTSVGFGMGVADWNGWLAGATVGIGYAGAGAFDDGNAWYGMADFIIGRDLSEKSSLGFVLDYDGNRTFMPDVPLPGFLWTNRINPQILFGIGFPVTSFEWKPNEQWTVTGKVYFPDSLEGRIDYSVIKTLGIFAQYNYRREAFHSDALAQGSDRIIYDSRRAEIGMRWSPKEEISVTLAGGYVYSQEFNVGFDVRDQDRIARPSDEPYVRFGLEMRY